MTAARGAGQTDGQLWRAASQQLALAADIFTAWALRTRGHGGSGRARRAAVRCLAAHIAGRQWEAVSWRRRIVANERPQSARGPALRLLHQRSLQALPGRSCPDA